MKSGGRPRSWTDAQLVKAVQESRSIRMVIQKLGLIPAGGNYDQIGDRIKFLGLDTAHFKGRGWNIGLGFIPVPAAPLD